MRIFGPITSLVTATVARKSSIPASGVAAIAVCSLARKFCTITSWMCPNSLCTRRIACTVSARSSRVSPMPTNNPVVNGIDSRPASVSVRSRTSGSLSGDP
jgi:hypothetical protein